MAARTGTSIGVGIALALLSVLTLGLFVTTAVFFGQWKGALRDLQQFTKDNESIIKAAERNRDDVVAMIDAAKKNQNQSLVGYLTGSLQETMNTVSGGRRDTVDQMKEKFKGVAGFESQNLLSMVRGRDSKIGELETQLTKANENLKTALEDLKNEQARVKGIEDRHNETVRNLSTEVTRTTEGATTYRGQADGLVATARAETEKARTDAADKQKQLEDEIGKLRQQTLVLTDQIAKLRGERKDQMLSAQPEYSLVDGSVAGMNLGDNTVIISIGRKNRVVLGMPFAVYGDAATLRPDADGELPRPKAAIEVIRVDETSSVCRVLAEARGTPVVTGDVIANPVYDPNKVYKFVINGNFDPGRTGLATPAGKTLIAAKIAEWGGQVSDDMSGDVDFAVLGERPMLPPRPADDAPLAVVQAYIEAERVVKKYDELFNTANSTSIPVLNENRLYTLLGQAPGVITAVRR